VQTNPIISISKADLQAALQQWEEDARAGGWKPDPEATPQQIARTNADLMWKYLNPA